MSTADVLTGGRLPLKETGRTVFVPLMEVEYLEADGNYVRVHAGNEHYFVREKLCNFENRLQGGFVRIHRSVIVNRNCVHEIRRLFGGAYLVTLLSGKQLKLSRTYRQQFQALEQIT